MEVPISVGNISANYCSKIIAEEGPIVADVSWVWVHVNVCCC